MTQPPSTSVEIDPSAPNPLASKVLDVLARLACPPEAISEIAFILAEHDKTKSSSACHKLNTELTVAVATDYFWQPMESCPYGVKVQLLGAGGVAVYGTARPKDKFWQGWAPLPKKPGGTV